MVVSIEKVRTRAVPEEKRRGWARAERESRDDRASGEGRRKKNAAGRLCHVTLFYSFFGPVVALMSSYARRGRDRSATRPDITSRATQLRAKGPSCDLRGDGLRTDRGERAIYSETASLGEERCKTHVMRSTFRYYVMYFWFLYICNI